MQKPLIKILLISDNSKDVLNFRMVSAEVKSARLDVTVAKSLGDAFAQMEREKPALALLDLALKGHKGLSALTDFHGKCGTVPVVVLVGREDQTLATEAALKGAQDYLVKGKIAPDFLYHVAYYAIERHRVMDEVREKNKELQRLNALKSEFVSTVSHELRTPLTVMLSASNNLLDGAFGELTDPQKKWVQKINHHSLRLNEMINDILDLSKLQSGKSPIKRTPVDIAELVKSVVTNLQTLAKQKNHSLTMTAPGKLDPVWADRSRIEQVITNLVTNAVKYTPAGGRIEASAQQSGKNVRVCVQDNGMGVAPEHQEIIFDRFRQVRGDGKSESSTQGIGLGLAICKEIVDQHQGRIWIESEPDKGSKFTFELPLDARGHAQPALDVLVVDDDVEIAQLMEMSLTQAGCNVTLARNGKHAIQILEDGRKFDVAYLDLMLPGATGVDVIKTIRRLKMDTDIVVVTAYPNSELLFDGMSTGPLTIIAKPFVTEDLLGIAQRRKAA